MMEIDDGNKVINEITVSCVHLFSMNTRIPSVFWEGLAYHLCLMSFMRCSCSISSIGPSGCPFRASIHFELCHGWAYLSQSQGKGFLVPGRTLPSNILQLPWSSCFWVFMTVYCLGRSLLSCVNVEVRGFQMLSMLLDSRVSCVGNKAPCRDVTIMFGYSMLFTYSNKVTPIAHLFLHIHRYTFVGMLCYTNPIINIRYVYQYTPFSTLVLETSNLSRKDLRYGVQNYGRHQDHLTQ